MNSVKEKDRVINANKEFYNEIADVYEKIDTIREKIEEWYTNPIDEKDIKEKNLLLALLLYEVSTRAIPQEFSKVFIMDLVEVEKMHYKGY